MYKVISKAKLDDNQKNVIKKVSDMSVKGNVYWGNRGRKGFQKPNPRVKIN